MHRQIWGLFILGLIMAGGVSFAQEADSKPLVVATTSIIADVAQNVGGEWVEVVALVPAGADVHAFIPLAQDIVQVEKADLFLVNGAGLEEFLGDLLDIVPTERLVTVSDGVPILPFGDHEHHEEEGDHDPEVEYIGVLGDTVNCGAAEHDEAEHAEGDHDEADHEDEHDHGICDPHVWTDPQNVHYWVDNIVAALSEIAPAHSNDFAANAAAYHILLDETDVAVSDILSAIPDEGRVLVTNHDFLAYFAARYGFEIVGVVLPGGTTIAEPDPRSLVDLIEAINAENVTAIVLEVSEAGRLSQTISGEVGRDISIITIYSGSLGDADSNAATYIDYLLYNAQVIADGLGG